MCIYIYVYIYILFYDYIWTSHFGREKQRHLSHFKRPASFSVHRVLCFWELIRFLQAIALTSRRGNCCTCQSCLLPEMLSSTRKSRIIQHSVHSMLSMLSVHPMHQNVAECRTFHLKHTALHVHFAESTTNIIEESKDQRPSVKLCPLRSGSETPGEKH